VNIESTNNQRKAIDLTNVWQETWRKAFGENKICDKKLVAKKRLTDCLNLTVQDLSYWVLLCVSRASLILIYDGGNKGWLHFSRM